MRINWRKPVIYLILYLSGSKIPEIIKEIKRVANFSIEDKERYQKEKLKKILLHAYNNVPYYRDVFIKEGIIENNQINLNNFNRIPLLTKKIIREQGSNLYSHDYKSRKYYENTSGGSTGEPIKLIQDRVYEEWNNATKIYFNELLGKRLGEKEIKLWGSDRDIIKGNLTLKDRAINFLYNRQFFNSYNFSKSDIRNLIQLNNRFQPVSYWAYIDSLLECSKYIVKNNSYIVPPEIIVSTIGPLDNESKNLIESAFKTKVHNQYGSREAGVLACQDSGQNELNVFFWKDLLEISADGKLLITSLNNYSMPLIRYEIGDVALPGNKYYGLCDSTIFFSIENVIGRTLGYFKSENGELKHSHFIVQQLFFRDWITKFQIVQHSIDLIEMKIVGSKNEKEMSEVEKLVKNFLGDSITIDWNFVDAIEPTPSGKYIYTVCEIN
ncbi:MAG: hypothetical protein WC244_01585 [Patescibacteria group bacterium]|jgi:phenylacetate-CoA ligase